MKAALKIINESFDNSFVANHGGSSCYTARRPHSEKDPPPNKQDSMFDFVFTLKQENKLFDFRDHYDHFKNDWYENFLFFHFYRKGLNRFTQPKALGSAMCSPSIEY